MDTIDSSVLPFDPFAVPIGASDSTYGTNFSPISLFAPLEDFGGDFTSDSAGSPSPVSPGLSATSYGFPTSDEWANWDAIEHSPEPFGSPILSSMPPKGGMTPAINPMALTMPTVNAFPYKTQGLRSQVPVFQPQQPQVDLALVPAPIVSSSTVQTKPEDTPAKRYPSRNPKRKSSSSASDDDNEPSPKRSSPSPPPPSVAIRRGSADTGDAAPKKTAHNMIEKRYRTNLNDKIARLRDAVPALRVVAQRLDGGPDEQQGEDASFLDDEFSGLAPVAKLNKATILSKATEYIAQLERRNRNLETENGALRGRMEGLEMLLIGRQAPAPAGVWN